MKKSLKKKMKLEDGIALLEDKRQSVFNALQDDFCEAQEMKARLVSLHEQQDILTLSISKLEGKESSMVRSIKNMEMKRKQLHEQRAYNLKHVHEGALLLCSLKDEVEKLKIVLSREGILSHG